MFMADWRCVVLEDFNQRCVGGIYRLFNPVGGVLALLGFTPRSSDFRGGSINFDGCVLSELVKMVFLQYCLRDEGLRFRTTH